MEFLLELINLYYCFYLLLLLSCLQVIVLNNPVYSVLYLIIVFILSSILFIISGIHFLGLVLMIVYLGAVVVLFLFVVMLLNIKILELRRGINFYPFILICLINFLLIITFLYYETKNVFAFSVFLKLDFVDWSKFFIETGSFNAIGKLLYTTFFFQFIISSTILFIAMVGAIVLTLSQLKFFKKPDYFKQILRNRKTILLVQIG